MTHPPLCVIKCRRGLSAAVLFFGHMRYKASGIEHCAFALIYHRICVRVLLREVIGFAAVGAAAGADNIFGKELL